MRVNDYNCSEGKVKVRSDTITRPIVISGREHMNRAFDGDIVAIELLPKSEWGKVAKSTIRVRDDETGAEIGDDENHGDRDAATMWRGDLVDGDSETGSIAAASAAARASNGGDSAGTPQLDTTVAPRGRVVGIITRKWRPHGSLSPPPAPLRSSLRARSLMPRRVVFSSRSNATFRKSAFRLGRATLRDMRILVCVDEWDVHSAYHGPLCAHSDQLGIARRKRRSY